MSQNLLTILEVAKKLGVSRVTIFNRIKTGKIPALKKGKMYLIKEEDVPSLVSQQVTPGEKETIDKAVEKSMHEYGEALKKLKDT